MSLSKCVSALLLSVASVTSGCFVRLGEIAAPGASLTLVQGGFSFTEGAASDSRGNVYFTDQPNDRIMKWDVGTNTVSTWMQPAGRSNGLIVIDNDQKLLACADENNQMWSIDIASKQHEVIVNGTYDGKLLNGPNDVWWNPVTGRIYFTDPYYQRSYWTRGGQELPQYVYTIDADGSLRAVITDLQVPNGIIGTPDGKTLYVADLGQGKTFRYDIDAASGDLTGKTLLCNQGSDGMTIDNKGNLYLSGATGLTVYDSNGNNVDSVAVPESWTGNVCFGGDNRASLAITASTGFYTLETDVLGVGSQ